MKILRRFRVGGFLGAVALAALLSGTVFSQDVTQDVHKDAPKKVSKSEGLNAATTKVAPDYPAIAKQLKIEGAVELEALVTESGAVEKVNIVSGNPVLTRPASDAVKKWKFGIFSINRGRSGRC